MAILQDTVRVKITKYNINHYLSKGYDAIDGYYIDVKVSDLSHGSGIKILVRCDYCGKEFMKSYRDYLKTEGDVCCMDCRKYKFAKTNMERYGTACTLNNPDIHKKAAKTFMEKYGAEYPLSSEVIQRKCRETFNSKYNSNSYRLTPSDISRISREQNSKHGVCSKEQQKIHSIIGGELNIRVGKYIVDILFPDEKIAFEYNGGGHALGVIHGRMTMDELMRKDYEKYKFMMNNGFKCFVLENKKYGLPSDDDIKIIKEKGFSILQEYSDMCVYIYDIVNHSESLLKINDL